MVAARWSWVAIGVLLGKATADCQTPYNGGLNVVMGWESEIRNDVAESKMAREMLCFTIETAVVGRKGRICETAGAGYVRAMFELCSRRRVGVLLGNAIADC